MLGLLGDEWTLLIIQRALLGAARFGQFAAELPVSNAVLSNRLQTMTADGLLVRREYQTKPPRSEYLLTPTSRSLWPMLTSIWHWERRWVPDHHPALPGMRHLDCDSEFAPTVTCTSCGAVTGAQSVVAQWGPSGSWPRSIPAGTHRRRSAGRRDGAGTLFPETMSVIGDRWAFALLVANFVGVSRFSEFQSQLAAPPATVADRLASFCRQGVLANPAGRYTLTDKGRDFFPVLVCALAWAQRWFSSPEGPAVILTHTVCGRRFNARLACDRCGQPLRGAHIRPV
ncbi:winged helix-turn-helix transcriptional regulator [Mycobacterium sp. SMC-4]|nr:winged helix-turn-helix transcriptional regulator [Mycobacterium sp. SMC-4]